MRSSAQQIPKLDGQFQKNLSKIWLLYLDESLAQFMEKSLTRICSTCFTTMLIQMIKLPFIWDTLKYGFHNKSFIMNAHLVSCPIPVIPSGWVQQQTHPKRMTGIGQLIRGAFREYCTCYDIHILRELLCWKKRVVFGWYTLYLNFHQHWERMVKMKFMTTHIQVHKDFYWTYIVF